MSTGGVADLMVTFIYDVKATPWNDVWELDIEGFGVTQVRSLAKAERQVRDYIETVLERDIPGDCEFNIIPMLGELTDEVEHARELTHQAEALTRDAARESREVVQKLRRRGLSLSDAGAVLKVSRARVSQLSK